MEKTLDLAQIGRDILTYKNLPEKLDGINITLAGWYAYYSSRMIPLEVAEASFWEKTKNYKSEKPTSDAMVKALWKITKEGYEMIEIERTLKTIEKLMSTLRTSLARHDRELRNTK
jgi:enolase